MTAALVCQPSVADLIAAERVAFERYEAACRATREELLGREPTEAEHDEYDVASEAQVLALDAVLEAPASNSAEVLAQIDLFVEREDWDCLNPHTLKLLLASIKSYVAEKPYKGLQRALSRVQASREEDRRNAERAEQQVRSLTAERRRARERLAKAENRLASMGVRL